MDEKIIELCKPVQKYLQENHNPYVEVVIYDEGVKIKQTIAFSPRESDQSGN